MTSKLPKLYRVLMVIGIVVSSWTVLLQSSEGLSVAAVPAFANAGDYPNCRLGAGVTRRPFATYNYTPTRLGWFLDWGVSDTQPAGIDYYRTIHTKQYKLNDTTYLPSYYTVPELSFNPGGLGPIVQANPGKLWIIGNEPDRPISQDDDMPDMYAQIYHDAYWFIKGIDPTAKIAIGAVVEPTPLRLKYLDMVLQAYRTKFGSALPVDVWNTHLYIIPEKYHDAGAEIPPGITATAGMLYTPLDHLDINVYSGLVRALRTWMKDRGYQNVPLIITEYGALYPLWYLDDFGLTQNSINNFIAKVINLTLTQKDLNIGYPGDDYRLVQQAAIYSLDNDSTFPNYPPPDNAQWGSFLFRSDPPYTRTVTGDAFVATVQTLQPSVDLLPSRPSTEPASLIVSPSETISPTFRVNISNAGDVTFQGSTVVTFTDVTGGGSNLVGATSVPSLAGCGITDRLASVVWPNLSPGVHVMRVEVDPGSQAGETIKSNNVMTTSILVGTNGIYLPLVQR